MNDSRPRAEREQRSLVGMTRRRLVTDRDKVSDPRRRPNKINVTAERARREIKGVVHDEAAIWIDLAVTQIERLGKTD